MHKEPCTRQEIDSGERMKIWKQFNEAKVIIGKKNAEEQRKSLQDRFVEGMKDLMKEKR